MITSDPFMLLSIINTRLRDVYSSLENLCDDMDESIDEIKSVLKTIGYVYNAEQNRFEQE